MKLELEKAQVILGFIGVSWVSRGTLSRARGIYTCGCTGTLEFVQCWCVSDAYQ